MATTLINESGTIAGASTVITSSWTYFQKITLSSVKRWIQATKIRLYLANANVISDWEVKVVLYDDNSGSPGDIISSKYAVDVSALSSGYYDFDMTESPISNPAIVWVGIIAEDVGDISARNASSGTNGKYDTGNGYAQNFTDPATPTNNLAVPLWAELTYAESCYNDTFALVNNDSGVDTVTFLDSIVRLRNGSWGTGTPSLRSDYTHVKFGAQPRFSHFGVQVEQFGIVSEDDADNIVDEITALENLVEAARESNEDPMNEQFSFLRAYSEHEDPKQTLIYQASMRLENQNGVKPFINDEKMLGRVSLSRHPLWESVYDTKPTISDTGLSVLGGTLQYSSLPGTTLARIEKIQIDTDILGPSTSEVWVGIRPEYGGLPYDPLWEAEDGSNGTGTSGVVDATASGGSKKQVVFSGTSSLVERTDIELSDVEAVAATRLKYRGKYLVLARMQVTSGATVGVQMYTGATNSIFPAPEIFITDNHWNLYALGEIEMPLGGSWPAMSVEVDPKHSNITIYAEHISGTVGSDVLDIDCYVLIPSKHLLHISDATLFSGSKYACAYTYVNDIQKSFNINDTDDARDQQHNADFREFYLPKGSGIIVVAANRGIGTDTPITDTLSIDLTYVPRWTLLRND